MRAPEPHIRRRSLPFIGNKVIDLLLVAVGLA
jgi:hypothetical protein